MKPLGIAAALTLVLGAGCGGSRDKRTASDDPCLHMRAEARTVARLENDILRLAAQLGETADTAREDSIAKVDSESLLAYKREILAQTKTSMSASARACNARNQPFDRYRTAPEREDNLL